MYMDKEQNDQWYNSDGQIGPFFDTIYDEATLHVGYGEEFGIGDTKQATDIPPPDADITHSYINKIKALHLKEELNVEKKTAAQAQIQILSPLVVEVVIENEKKWKKS